MVDNVTGGSVCTQSLSFMPELDGEKNKTQLIIDDKVRILKILQFIRLKKKVR